MKAFVDCGDENGFNTHIFDKKPVSKKQSIAAPRLRKISPYLRLVINLESAEFIAELIWVSLCQKSCNSSLSGTC